MEELHLSRCRFYIYDFTPVAAIMFLYSTFCHVDLKVPHKTVVLKLSFKDPFVNKRKKPSARLKIVSYVSSSRLVGLFQHNQVIYHHVVFYHLIIFDYL